MIDRLRRALLPANTHTIGWGGFALATVGIWGPLATVHFFPGIAPDVKTAIQQYGAYLAGLAQAGVAAALVGRAPQIKGGP